MGLLAALLLLVAVTPGARAGTLDTLRKRGEIVIGTDATYPPFEWKEEGAYRGFDIDLGNALAQQLGVKAHWVNVAFDGIFPALLAGKFDLVISITTITPERQRILAFSDPYYTAGNILAVRKADAKRFPSLSSLIGHTVGAQLNTTGQFVVEKFGGIEVRKYNSIDLPLTDLRNGRIDAVSADAPALWWAIKTGFPDLVTVGDFITHEQYGMPMRKSDPDLVAAVNAALAALRANGTYDRIYNQWFGKGLTPQKAQVEKNLPASATRKTEFLGGAGGAIARGLLLGAVWTVQLTLAGLVGGLALGLILALMRLGSAALPRAFATFYVEVTRGTPLLVQVFFIYFVLPEIGVRLPQLVAGMVALAFNSAAYIAEIFRAGIESVDPGQREAALALGLTERQGMRWIVLPQAFRRVIPPLTNEAIALLKDSSLVSVMGLSELTRSGQELASYYAMPVTIWPIVAVLYLLLTLPLTLLSRRLERRMATP